MIESNLNLNKLVKNNTIKRKNTNHQSGFCLYFLVRSVVLQTVRIYFVSNAPQNADIRARVNELKKLFDAEYGFVSPFEVVFEYKAPELRKNLIAQSREQENKAAFFYDNHFLEFQLLIYLFFCDIF